MGKSNIHVEINEKNLRKVADQAIDDALAKDGLEVTCPNCNTKFKLRRGSMKCPKCGTEFRH